MAEEDDIRDDAHEPGNLPDDDAGACDDIGSPVSSGDEEEVAHCPRCLTPFEPLQHYCAKCGLPVGKVATYIEYINIPAWGDVYRGIWNRAWRDPGAPLWERVLCVLIIGLTAPIMLLGPLFNVRSLWHERHDHGGEIPPGNPT